VPAVPQTDSTPATRDDIRRLEELIAALRVAMERITHDQDVQFKRIAQLQADIDLVRAAWAKRAPDSGGTESSKRPSYAGPERRLTARKK
jgi:hypothetical protein